MAGLTKLNVANVVAYIVNTIVTFSSTAGVFGETNTVVSAKYQTVITPAGWAFSIWGVIFVSELLFVVAQCAPAVRSSDLVQNGVGWGWVVACTFQCVWTLAFGQEQLFLSTVFIFGIFLSLGVVVYRSATIAPLESFDAICRYPLTLHFAWLAAASVLNVNLVVVQQGGSISTQLATGLTSLAIVLVLSTQLAAHEFSGRAVNASVACWALLAIASELASPMDKDECESFTGGDDCNMISEIFDSDTLLGVQKTALALAVVSGATVLLAVAASARAVSSSSPPVVIVCKGLPVHAPLV